MANEVVANQKQVVQWAWLGAQALQQWVERYQDRPSDVLEDAKDEKVLLDTLRRRALAAAHRFMLTADEAELLGSIADRSFFDEWKADFEEAYDEDPKAPQQR